ncbi:MAG: hypothetical protein D4R65_12380 [Verrucomicrobiaceae bacterium]|nr:MAG: hypothetical protein D4R65_12380 [Verrucomicrobiaceae bacterium]
MLFTLLALVSLAVLADESHVALDKKDAGVDNDDVLLFSFFRDNGKNGVYLAVSEDGVHFSPLNDDMPVMKPAPWEEQNITRDPSMVFHDGKFYAVWSSGWSGKCFGYAESKDLVHWSEPVKVVPPFPANQIPRNTWAPEICWDPGQKNFMIFWSSQINAKREKQIFVTRTVDGKEFSVPELSINPNFNCIDGSMALDDSEDAARWVMIYKNAEPDAKNLYVATAPSDFSCPWSLEPNPIVGRGTAVRPNECAEGPSLVKWKGSWYLYWDAYMNRHYSMASSTDLKSWTDRTAELQMPPHPRHGTVFRAPRSAVGWLKQRE